MPQRSPHTTIWNWINTHGLLVISGFLLAFIPLFPKIPFFSPIEQYIVRVRFEDVLVTLAIIWWGIHAWRRQIRWNSAVTWFIVSYIIVSFLSVVSALFVIKTVPLEPLHAGKTILHFLRYIEYFSLFFIVFSSIRNRTDVKLLLGIVVITLMGIIGYGYGQKYHYWPVYSTMNREFSKGVRLYLTEHARVQSTFAGHYDLAAYLVIVLPLTLALAYGQPNKWLRSGLFIVYVAGVWLLIVGASRTSFVAFGVGMALVIWLFARHQPTWWRKIRWAGSQLIVHGLIVVLLLSLFGADIYERFVQVIDSYPAVSRTYHQLKTQKKSPGGSVNPTTATSTNGTFFRAHRACGHTSTQRTFY